MGLDTATSNENKFMLRRVPDMPSEELNSMLDEFLAGTLDLSLEVADQVFTVLYEREREEIKQVVKHPSILSDIVVQS